MDLDSPLRCKALASLPISVIRNAKPIYCKCRIFLEKLFRYSEEGAE